MDMIERVARGQADFDGRGWMAMSRGERGRYIQRARLAIQDIREPTEAMEDAGTLPTYQWIDESAAGVWKRMIDAALKEGE